MLGEDVVSQALTISPDEGRLRARLYARGAVTTETTGEDGKVVLQIKLPRLDFERLLQEERLDQHR